ncbi:MAG: GNAT family N-acetyltransferase [Desulfobacterales bacterium]|nr:GNAT family N-acetyltransferase [Desulfobacterales bacterium]MCP4159464.1 GNAT family N-acetyltransferase [Deltaproteobacteria bacterium]
MKIQILDKEHLYEIEDLWKELNDLHRELSTDFKEHFELFTFEKRCEQLYEKDELRVFVACVEEKNIGYCIVTQDRNDGEVDSLFIQKRYRGQDVGNQLMQNGLKWLNEKQCTNIKIHVAEGNEFAIGFYEKFGFKKRFTTLQVTGNL